VEVDYGDQTTTTHHYNDSTDLRLNQIETSTASPSTVWQRYQYAFDGNGNVTAVTDYCDEGSTGPCMATVQPLYSSTYAYDSREQLVQAVRNNNVEYNYAYDNIGNLTNMEGTKQIYPSGLNPRLPHAIQSIGGVSYQYDNNGNTAGTTGGSPNFSISWNAENMPTSMTYGTTTTTKSFVGESIWKKVVAGTTTTTTYYLPSMRVEDGGVYRKYYGSYAERDGTDTSRCSDQPAKGCLKFYHGDHLGSSRLVMEVENVHNIPTPTVIYRQAYTAYGEDIVPPSTFTFTPKKQFTFKEKDEVSGFYDYGARVYNPATGRWLSADSHADSHTADGLNRYAYVRNNPLGNIDPSGHDDVPTFTIHVDVHDHKPTATTDKFTASKPSNPHELMDLMWTRIQNHVSDRPAQVSRVQHPVTYVDVVAIAKARRDSPSPDKSEVDAQTRKDHPEFNEASFGLATALNVDMLLVSSDDEGFVEISTAIKEWGEMRERGEKEGEAIGNAQPPQWQADPAKMAEWMRANMRTINRDLRGLERPGSEE
jgi:RHS repeat-associated protein